MSFKGEVPLFARNADNLTVRSNIENNVEVIEYTFYKLPPAQSKRILPDKVPDPVPYKFTEEEIKIILSESRAKRRDDKLNAVNARIKSLSNLPMPYELDELVQIDTDLAE